MARRKRGKGAKSAAGTRQAALLVDRPTDEGRSDAGGFHASGVSQSHVDRTEPGVEQPFTSPLGGVGLGDVFADADLAADELLAVPEDIGSDAISVVDLGDIDAREELRRAIAIGLLIGVAIGLVIDAILSNLLFGH